jgi:hypothetical protein
MGSRIERLIQVKIKSQKAGRKCPAFFMCKTGHTHKCLLLLYLNGIAKNADMSIILLSIIN